MKKILTLFTVVLVIIISLILIISCDPIAKTCFAKASNSISSLDEHTRAEDFKKAKDSGDYKLIDIRTVQEYNSGHIADAVQVDYYQTQNFLDYLDSLDRNQKYLIYCRSGNRTAKALQIMRNKGFTSVSDLQGGINAWISAGYELEK